jgi:acyl-[acyl-carrier-protein]-phospholipid O-acyltransferase/long-chain-fatty-acid--[acyl-carrier-protein] ligase
MLKAILKFVCRILFRVQVNKLSKLPSAPNLLLIAKYESWLDALLLVLFVPIELTLLVPRSAIKYWLFRQVLCLGPYLAIDPSSAFAIRPVIKLLASGKPLLIFPEGRLTQNAAKSKVYAVAGFVAATSGALIVPLQITRTARKFFSGLADCRAKSIFPKVTISILANQQLSLAAIASAKTRRRLASDAIRSEMQQLNFQTALINTTLFSAFLAAMNSQGRRTAMVEDMHQIEQSYGELLKKSLALGRLVTKVSQPHENVGVLMPNVSNTICLIFGLSAFARIPAMLNYTSGAAGMQSACSAAAIKTIISSREFIKVAALEDVIAGLHHLDIIYLEDLRSRFNWRDKLWLFGFALWLPRLASRQSQANDAAVVLFTSGSEGKPKGVVHTHQSILANIAQIKSVIDFSIADKVMMVLPLFHAFGFTCGAIMPLVAGSRLLLYPSPLHYRLIPGVIYHRGCTILFGTSTFLANYAKYANPHEFNSLRYVVAGAEKLNTEVRKTWANKFNLSILEGYGSTECAPVLAVNTPLANRLGSVGVLLPGLEPSLTSIAGIDAGGLLSVRGPNVMLGYYLFEQPGVIQPLAERWYNTGDIVEIDADGYVFIKGRIKRFAKVAGEMVSLEAVEHIALHASPQHQHAAISCADNTRGENIMLYTTDAALNRERLSRSARALGNTELAVARKVIVIKQLPLLGSGKTDYVILKTMAENH